MQYAGPNKDVTTSDHLQVTLDESVLTIRLNRPNHRNALSVRMVNELESVLIAARDDQDVHVIVLRGQGDGFCAGLDADDFQSIDTHGEQALKVALDAFHHLPMRVLPLLPQPVIAMVHGYCEAEAIGLLEGCDIVLTADDALFLMAKDRCSGMLDGVTAKSVSRVMCRRASNFYALTGNVFDGTVAERSGLVTLSVSRASLETETGTLARDLAAKDPLAAQFTKDTLRYVHDMSWDGVLNFTAAKFAELKSLQAGRPSARAVAVERFLSGQLKPGKGG